MEALSAMKRLAGSVGFSICMEVWENPMDWKIGQTPGMWTTFAASFIQPEVWFGVKSDRKMTSSNDWQWLNETASPQCIRGKNLMPSSFHGMHSKVSSLLSVLSQSILVSEDLDIWWLRGGHRAIHQPLWPAPIPHTGLGARQSKTNLHLGGIIYGIFFDSFRLYRQIWTYIDTVTIQFVYMRKQVFIYHWVALQEHRLCIRAVPITQPLWLIHLGWTR